MCYIDERDDRCALHNSFLILSDAAQSTRFPVMARLRMRTRESEDAGENPRSSPLNRCGGIALEIISGDRPYGRVLRINKCIVCQVYADTVAVNMLIYYAYTRMQNLYVLTDLILLSARADETFNIVMMYLITYLLTFYYK